MNPFLRSSEYLLRDWRSFRRDLIREQTDQEQLEKVAEYWTKPPLSTYFLDWDHPEKWMTPWEILFYGNFCRSTIAYMMEQTLLLSDCGRWTTDRLELWLVKDSTPEEIYILLVVDGKYALNNEHGKVNELTKVMKTCQVMSKYRLNEEGHEEIN